MNYCFEEVETALKKLKTGKEGLSAQEAASRLKAYGANEIEKSKPAGIFKLFFSQFKDFMTLLLIAAAAVSGLIAFLSKDRHDLTDTFIILAIIFMNAVVGTVQQYRADKAIENLKKLSAGTSKVRRDGREFTVPSAEVTVGDIVLLEEGDVIPADCRIIECNGLLCDESALTGESGGVEKNTERIRGNSVALGNMKNSLFGSSFVMRGNGSAVVTAVGMGTEMGKIAAMLQGEKPALTPLEKSLDKLGKIISVFVLAVTAVVFAAGLIARQNGILKNFMTAVAVAVAAIPEGLPAVVTIIMAMGVQKMSKKGVVIRKLKSVETLGSCSVICSDKTGTLTRNELTVERVVCSGGCSGEIREKLLQCMCVCNSVKGSRGAYLGDPTEIAFKKYADKEGFSPDFTRTGEIPFTSERKMMTVSANLSGKEFSFTKGAPDILIKKCSKVLTGEGVKPLTAEGKKKILAENDGLSDGALRVLGFAYTEGAKCEENLIFIGLCGLADGLKEGVYEAVADCKRAGVTTVMITGDHVRTAYAVAKKLGIANDMGEVMTGEQLDALSKKELDAEISKRRVFARVSPKHKNLIVKSLQRRGKVVAMTGDGINDAPGIKSADIGIAMGVSGTDVTKSASDMVICDDNFTTIVSAVREGRRISSNIKKTISFFLSTNLAEVLAILIASLFLFKFDFLQSTQLLWLNLITDSFPVLALGAEREDSDIMSRPPERAEKSLFSKISLISIAYYGLYITAATLGIFLFSLDCWGNEVATTMTFMVMSFLELFQSFNIRTEKSSAFGKGMFSNRALWITVAVAVAVNVLLCVSPLSAAFGLTPLNSVQWLIVFGASLSVIPAGEIFKLALRLAGRRRSRKMKISRRKAEIKSGKILEKFQNFT